MRTFQQPTREAYDKDYGRVAQQASIEARLTRELDSPSLQRTEMLLAARVVIKEHLERHTAQEIPDHIIDTMFSSMVGAMPVATEEVLASSGLDEARPIAEARQFYFGEELQNA